MTEVTVFRTGALSGLINLLLLILRVLTYPPTLTCCVCIYRPVLKLYMPSSRYAYDVMTILKPIL